MIEITDGFTSITAGVDPIAPLPWSVAGNSQTPPRRAATGARITLEFSRAAALPPNQPIKVRYEFGGGTVRDVVGIAKPIRVEALRGRPAIYHYRLSHWIAPAMCGNAPTLRPSKPRREACDGEEPQGDLILA